MFPKTKNVELLFHVFGLSAFDLRTGLIHSYWMEMRKTVLNVRRIHLVVG